MLRVEGLRVWRGDREVIRGLDMHVSRGEVVALFGPNGAGKSTLLSAIMGVGGLMLKGNVYFNGEDITQKTPTERARMGIALVYQFPPEIEGVRVRELAGIVREKFRGRPVLDLSHLSDRELFVNLSGGEKKMVEVCITALMNPSFVMLDEPDSGLDIENVENVAGQINYWIDTGVSILVVTHAGKILDYLDRVDRAAVLVGGRIVAEGDVDEIYAAIERGGYGGFVEESK